MMLALMIVSGMLAITTLGEVGSSPTSTFVVGPACSAVLFGYLFFRHINRLDSPIIAPRLIRGRDFAVMNLLNVLLGGAGFGFGVLIPLYAENRFHISVSSAGTVLSAQAVGMATVAAGATYLLRRTGYRRPMAVGFLIVSASLLVLSMSPHWVSPYWWLSLTAMFTGIGLGCVAPASNNATMALAPLDVAAISGLRATFRQTGSITSVSLVTAIIARSANPGIAQSHVFWVLSGILVLCSFLTRFVPDRRGSW
jgi:MFS family permease